MSIFTRKKRLLAQLDAVLLAKSRGKNPMKLIDSALSNLPDELTEEDEKALAGLKFEKAVLDWESGKKTEALDSLLDLFEGEVEEDWTAQVADWIRRDQITDDSYRFLLEKRLEIAPEDRRANLSLAKMVAEKPDPAAEDIDIVARAVKEYPLWKGGSSVLSVRFLEEGRTDSVALDVYKFAYPHNKSNEKLIAFLTKSLIENQDRSEFALKFYRDQLDAGRDIPKALGLLSDSYLEKGDIAPTTWPFIVDALGRGMLSPEAVKHVSDFVLTSNKDYFDRKTLAVQVYEAGYRGSELLGYLADQYAAHLNINEKTIPVFQDAFKQHALSKKSIRVMTEHFLENDNKSEFAARVYETYLSMVPELPQRKLYTLLSEHFIELGRTDEQARKIYEEALVTEPEKPELIRMLAQTYLSYNIDTEVAFEVYRRAFNLSIDRYTRQNLSLVLAEHNINIKRFDEETLEYLNLLKGAFPSHLENKFTEALGYCFMNLDRRDKAAKSHYRKIYESTKNPPPRLIRLLASIAVDEHKNGKPFASDTIELFEQVFDLERFSCDPDVGFALLEHRLRTNLDDARVTQLAVRTFEADVERLTKLLRRYDASDLFVEVGDFYAERFNFEMATVAYREAVEQTGSDASRFRLAKMLINEGNAGDALKILSTLSVSDSQDMAENLYWQGVCHLVLGSPKEASRAFQEIKDGSELKPHIPSYLIELRLGQALELDHKWRKARDIYRAVLDVDEAKNCHRWCEIEIAQLYIKEGRLKDALEKSEELFNKNRTGRAECRYFAMSLLYNGAEALRKGDLKSATGHLTQAVQVDLGDRLLRDVITDLFLIEGEKAFFKKDYKKSQALFEISLAILPKRIDTRSFLAFSLHELRDYDQAILHFANIPWDKAPTDLEISQAYAYYSSGIYEKAWRVFLDLLRKDKFRKRDMPLLFESFLAEKSWGSTDMFKGISFDDDSLEYVQLYLHDGQYRRAIELLEKLKKTKKYKGDLNILWFLGFCHAKMLNREMAVHYWREILKRSDRPGVDKSRRIAEYLEIGLAFLEAGYAKEAMQTWKALSEIDPDFEHLPRLYADTFSLNAYQIARKEDKTKVAINEWKKALKYKPKDARIVQNLAIAYWQIDDFTNSTRYWNRMIDWWKRELDKKPRDNAVMSVYIAELQRVLTDLITTRGRQMHDLAKVRTEDVIDYYQKANQFYWLLNLDKRANIATVERSYFRLVKIYNPERYAEDFMLLEEAYANLTDPAKKEKIDLFAYNPLYLDELREVVWGGRKHVSVFGALRVKAKPPVPVHTYLEPSGLSWEEVMGRMDRRLKMNLKLPDWNLV